MLPETISIFTRRLVFISTLAAAATVAYLSANIVHSLPVISAIACVAGASLSSRLHGPAIVLALAPVYVAPAAFLLLVGHNFFPYVIVWMAGLLGVIGGSSLRSPWSLPGSWRWPLITWALVVALSWPLVAARELDYSLALLWASRLPVAGGKISVPAAVLWVAFTATTHLIGLLWIDWLCATYQGDARRPFRREVVAPLATGLAVACLVGVYQGFVDVGFVSGHVWPSMRRAAGTLMDANVFGMIAALWGPAFLAWALSARRPTATALGVAGLFLTWAGVWTSGSRTALLAAAVGVVIAAPEMLKLQPSSRTTPRLALAVAAVVAILIAVLATFPAMSATAFQRGRYLVPSFSLESMRRSAATLWEREGYGTASVAMIREFPFAGVGIGSYYVLVHDVLAENAGYGVPPDNAQNWYRHQLSELGLIGSVGWLIWIAVCARQLWPRRGAPPAAGAALRGPLIGLALASLVGMPGQEPAVVITFWTFMYWYAADAGIAPGTPVRKLPALAWAAMFIVVGSYVALRAIPGDLRPAGRAVRFGFPYTYGFYFDRPDMIWSAKHGVTVLKAPQPWMKLTVWAAHPDADRRPLDTRVWVDGTRVLDRKLPRNRPVVEYARMPGEGKRFVVEVKVDRTFRPKDAEPDSRDVRELGLAMKWEFVPARPAVPAGGR